MSAIKATSVGLVVAYFMLSALTVLNNYTTPRIGQSMMNDLRGALYNHLHRLSLAFHNRRQVVDLLYRVTTGISPLSVTPRGWRDG